MPRSSFGLGRLNRSLGVMRPSGAVEDFDYHVDSVGGNDANDGKTEATAFATIGALTGKITTGTRIGLACGSTWREQLTITANNVTIGAYGTGAKPILDCADPIAAEDWSKTGGLTNVYQCTKSPALEAAETYNGVFEDGTPLTRVANTATCDSTPGSFCSSSDTVAPCTLYCHPTGNTDPASNGKTYEFSSRLNAINAYGCTGIRITGIHGKRGLNGSGNFRLGNSSYLTDCLSSWGVKHNYYFGDGCTLTDCVATDIRLFEAGQTGTMYVYNADTPAGLGITLTRCIAQNSTANTTCTGFYGHRNGAVGLFGTVTYQDCQAIECGTGFNGLNANTVINNPTVTNCTYGFATQAGSGSLTISGGSFATNRTLARSVGLGVTGEATISGLSVTHGGSTSGASVYIAADVAPTLTLTNCTFTVQTSSIYSRAYGNVGGTINVSGCEFKGGSTDSSVYLTVAGGPAITSDNNNFDLATYNCTVQGTGYTDIAAYQAGTGQDAHSTIG